MRCARARNLFSSYLENELDTSARVKFEEHLAGCSKCKAAFERFNVAVVVLDEVPELDPPADFHERVMARVRESRAAAPLPVKWWRIDWQHVFTIRLPARSAALALATIFLFAVAMQWTPLGTVVRSGVLTVVQRIAPVQTELTGTAPPIDSIVAYDEKGIGLSVGVEFHAGSPRTRYDLWLKTDGSEPVEYSVTVNGQAYRGTVSKEQKTTISVQADDSTDLQVASVKWTHDGKGYVKQVFLPRQFDANANRKKLSLSFADTTVYNVLSTVARRYGVVVIASGNLNRAVPFASVTALGPEDALYQVAAIDDKLGVETSKPLVYVVYEKD